MPDNPITVPLPQDLPTNWTYGQTIGATGTDVGLTQQHGYNYLMQQVNAAQQAAQEVGIAFENLTAADVGAIPDSAINQSQSCNVYVDKTGSDTTGTGTQTQPYLTIQKAISQLPGQLAGKMAIHIGPGTYDESIVLDGPFGNTEMTLDAPEGDVHVKSAYLRNCAGNVVLKDLDFYGENSGSYHASVECTHCNEIVMQGVSCTGEQSSNPNIAAITASWGTKLYMSNCTISNKQVALDCMGSTVYLNQTVTGENNTVAIRCGTGFGSYGGFVLKGGATIAGAEQTAFSGQIFD